MLTSLKLGEVQSAGGGQGYVTYHTLAGGHNVFQPQTAGDVKCAVLILDGWTSGDTFRNLLALGILLGPRIPYYDNVLWVEPTCLTQNIFVAIIFHLGLLSKQGALWGSCQGREVMI